MRRINVGIVAHADAGKTTLTEQLLYLCGQIKQPGRVDEGTAHTDYLDFERRRGISARASCVVLDYAGAQINLIDTPGHVDFISEVERSLMTLDLAVVVISAVEGVQGQTRALLRALDAMEIPALLFFNKVDRVGSDVDGVAAEIARRFGLPVALLNTLEGEGTRDCNIGEYRGEGGEALMEALADVDDALAERYLAGLLDPPEALQARLLEAILARELRAGIAGAALLGRGAESVLGLLGALARAPEGLDEPPLGYVHRAFFEPGQGMAASVRLFSGRLKTRDSVLVQRLGEARKITQIRRMSGQKSVDTGMLEAGDIATLYGLEDVRTGDVLGEGMLPRRASLAAPTMQARVYPDDPARLGELVRACELLTHEDPMLGASYVNETRELRVRIAGKLHLELLAAQLRERFALEVTFGPPTVIYKETPAQAGRGFAEYTMPKPCWAIVGLWIEPLPRGSGVELCTTAEDRHIMRRYQNHVLQCLPEALLQGLYGWEVTDVRITLTDGQHHLIHTHPLDFFLCTPMALMDGLERCGTVLLEPMVRAEMSGPVEALPRVMGEVLSMRGEMLDSHRGDAFFELSARLPVATSMDWPEGFAALTGGRGILEQAFDGYAQAPADVHAQTPRIGVDPRDRAKWILHKRNAL